MHECRDVQYDVQLMHFIVVGGLDQFAFVGDAIFAGSMGGPNVSYDNSLKALNDSRLPTILCWLVAMAL